MLCDQTSERVSLTEHDHHRLDQLDRRPLAVDGAAGVRREHRGLPLDVAVDPHVDGHHDEEHHQVGHGPEDQVAPAEDRRQLGAVVQVADAVPAQTRHGPHEDGDAPHQHDEQGHPPLRQVAVGLEVHDGDVSLQSDDQQVGQRGREADVQQALAEKVFFDRQFVRRLPGVEHEVHVGDARQEVWGGEVGEQIVERVVEPLVGDDSSYDHGVGEQDETAEEGAHHLHQDQLSLIPLVFSVMVEEAHGLIVMTALVLCGHFLWKEKEETQEVEPFLMAS